MYADYSKIIKFSELADPMDHWDLIEKIGEGTYGEVHMAKHKFRGTFVAKLFLAFGEKIMCRHCLKF